MSDIFVVSILTDNGQRMAFHYNAWKSAQTAYTRLTAERGENDFLVELTDDFGVTQTIDLDHVIVRSLEDPKRVAEAQVILALTNARAQAKAQKQAANDPTLQLLNPNLPPSGFLRS